MVVPRQGKGQSRQRLTEEEGGRSFRQGCQRSTVLYYMDGDKTTTTPDDTHIDRWAPCVRVPEFNLNLDLKSQHRNNSKEGYKKQ
jgi:hypothetical protein